MGKGPDRIGNLLRQLHHLHLDRLSQIDHCLELILCAKCQISSLIHNGDPGTDLLYLLHVMRRVNDRGSLPVQLLDPLQNLITALRIYRNRGLIQNDQLRFMGNSTCNI